MTGADCDIDPSKWGAVSSDYNLLSSQNLTENLQILRSAWVEYLGVALTPERWNDASEGVHMVSICARHDFTQFRVLHCLHFSKVKLPKKFPDVDSTCDRCKHSSTSHAHSFWHCPNLFTFVIQFSKHYPMSSIL